MSVAKKNFISNKSVLLAILIFLLFLGLAFWRFKDFQGVRVNANTATLTIAFDNRGRRIFRGPVIEQMTILDALSVSTQDVPDIKVAYQINSANEVNLLSINSLLNVGSHQWIFYLNRQLVKTKDINKIYIQPRDIIEVRFR